MWNDKVDIKLDNIFNSDPDDWTRNTWEQTMCTFLLLFTSEKDK